MSLVSQAVAKHLSLIVNFAAVLAAAWFTLGGLGYARDRVRVGAALLGFAAVLWTEPVMRTMFLGQIDLVLVALILWDLCQDDERRNKGFATGIAAGVKLVPLIFIPYLLVTRKFRQAAMTCAGFAATVLVGFVILPSDSASYWFGGVFASSGRTSFVGWEGNQSLDAMISRLAGSINAGKPIWLVAALITVAVGMYAAMLLYRAGYRLPALLVTGLTGDLVAPVSWDHHWVWIVPGAVVAGHYAAVAWRAGRKRLAWAYLAGIAAVLAVFACWPGSCLHTPKDAPYQFGLIWLPPQTSPFGPRGTYLNVDKPWFYEYHWYGLQLLTGNAYVLAGLAVARTPSDLPGNDGIYSDMFLNSPCR
jgi:alpha-1,2-mannosyltransferase